MGYTDISQDYEIPELTMATSDTAMERVYTEYKEIFVYLRHLGVTNTNGIILDRINLGYVEISDKFINHLKNCKNKNSDYILVYS